jgi:isopenicillin N synthase-like dioxygenase
MLARITGGLVPATTHRVVNPSRPEDDVPRYSMPFFTHPRPEVSLGLLPFAAKHPDAKPASDITAHAFLTERLAALGLVKGG